MKNLFAATLTLSVLSGSLQAFAGDHQKIDTKTRVEIKTILEQQGYSVAKIKLEDDIYEAYARKQGGRYEIYLDKQLQIVRIKQE